MRGPSSAWTIAAGRRDSALDFFYFSNKLLSFLQIIKMYFYCVKKKLQFRVEPKNVSVRKSAAEICNFIISMSCSFFSNSCDFFPF